MNGRTPEAPPAAPQDTRLQGQDEAVGTANGMAANVIRSSL